MTVPSYPGYPGPAPVARKRPTTVTVAAYLLYLVAACNLLDVIIELATFSRAADAIKQSYAGTSLANSASSTATVSLVFSIAVSVVLAVGFATLGLLDSRGSNVARIITWVVGGLGLCCNGISVLGNAAISSFSSSNSNVNQAMLDARPGWYQATVIAVAAIQLLAIIAVIILLLLPASNEYFRKTPAQVFDPSQPYPPYPGGQYGAYGQPPYPGQAPPAYPGQPHPGQPQYGQPGQPQYGQPGQPGQPQYGEPGNYGQPGQPAPGLPPYPGQPTPPTGSPAHPPAPSSPSAGEQPPAWDHQPPTTGSDPGPRDDQGPRPPVDPA